MTRPIEPHLRSVPAPDDDVVAVRGGPLTVDKFVTQAQGEARRHSCGGRPMAAVSVFCAVDGWTVETILRDILDTRSTYATALLGLLRQAGFEVLPTHNNPHFDIVSPEATSEAASTLLALFGTAQRNPYRRRR